MHPLRTSIRALRWGKEVLAGSCNTDAASVAGAKRNAPVRRGLDAVLPEQQLQVWCSGVSACMGCCHTPSGMPCCQCSQYHTPVLGCHAASVCKNDAMLPMRPRVGACMGCHAASAAAK
eukprot:scaffold24041_cov23-Tisochrysis_lutea.AAC.1